MSLSSKIHIVNTARIVIATRKQKALSVSLPFNIKAITKGGNNMENLIWKPVVGYEGLYEVSNTGLIKSLNCYNYKEPHLLKLGKRPDGYLSVGLSKNNVTKTKTVHRLVAEAFIPNPNNLEMVNHKDEDKTNNHADNLEWCSRSYNQLYSLKLHPERNKKFAENFKGLSPWTQKGVAHKNIKKVAIIDENNNIIKVFDNASVAGKELDILPSNIVQVCKLNAIPNRNKQRQIGKKRKARGHIFIYLED